RGLHSFPTRRSSDLNADSDAESGRKAARHRSVRRADRLLRPSGPLRQRRGERPASCGRAVEWPTTDSGDAVELARRFPVVHQGKVNRTTIAAAVISPATAPSTGAGMGRGGEVPRRWRARHAPAPANTTAATATT